MSEPFKRVLPRDLSTCLRGKRIDFAGFRLGHAGLKGLLQHPGFAKRITGATDLDLRGNRIGDECLALLAASPIAPTLSCLSLVDCALTAEGLAHLERFEALEVLDLRENELSPAAAQTLAGLSRAPHFDELTLSDNPLGSEGLAPLRRSIRANHFAAGSIGADATLGGNGSAGLDPRGQLDLSGSPLGDSGAEALVRWGVHPGGLSLQYSGIGDAGLAALVEHGTLTNARFIDLRGNPITADALATVHFLPTAIVKLGSLEMEMREFQTLKGLEHNREVRLSFDAIPDGYVLTCPYCEGTHDLSSHRCPHCDGDVTRDASTEQKKGYIAPTVGACPHCAAGITERAIRCGHCHSWLPHSEPH